MGRGFRRPKTAKVAKSSYKKAMASYPPEFNDEFKRAIRKRDGYRCALCNQFKRLDVHHIDYTKTTVKTNCISLCRDCHYGLHRSGWMNKSLVRFQLYQLAVQRESTPF
jgi:hypothetical protein